MSEPSTPPPVHTGGAVTPRPSAPSHAFSAAGVARQLDYCTYCPKMCRHSCPVSTATGHETWIPQAKMDRLNQARSGAAPWTAVSTEPLWACTGCRHCTAYCDHGNEPGLVLLRGRAEATARAAGHPRLAGYPDRFRAREQRLVKQLARHVPADRRASGAEDGDGPDADVGLWPGCDAVDKAPGAIAASRAVLARAVGDDRRVRVIDAGQACAGYPLLAAGYPDMFRWHAAKVARSLARFRAVVVNCSACVYTMRALYPAEGAPISAEVVSLPEALARSAGALPAAPAESRRHVYYHDPCYLARYEGVIDQPRAVLSRVAEVHELRWSRQDTECCGAGGLLPKTMPEVADAMARRRLRDVAARGGGTVVTACATCSFMLRRNAPDRVVVRELSEYLAEHLPEHSAQPAAESPPER